MSVSYIISFENDGIKFNYESKRKTDRSQKGKSLILSSNEYVVIDLETTGLDPYWDDIIELGALKIKNGEIIDSFSSLVKPEENDISNFITKLTGITNEMISTAPTINNILPSFNDFIGNSILLGHNVNFDINFLYDNYMGIFNKPLTNNFIDTMRISRRLFPEFNNHKLNTLIKNFNLEKRRLHRALDDCNYTYEIYEKIKSYVSIENIDLELEFKPSSSYKASEIAPTVATFDESHSLYGKICVFTGTLENMVRKDAIQLVVNLGGICGDTVNKKTNFLVLGNNDYCSTIKDGKSSKQKKAEKLMLEGQDLQIISENVFYDMIEFN